MRFAVCNEMFENWEFEEVCRFASQLGYEGVEVSPFTIARYVTEVDAARRCQLREAAGKSGIDVVGIHWVLAGTEGLHINNPDEAVRRKTTSYLRELVNFCADIGGSIIVVGSPKQRMVVEGLTYQRAWELAKETLAGCLEEAKQRGVSLCLEPLSRDMTNFINTAAEAARLVREINHPNMRMMLDVRSMCDEGVPSRVIEEYGGLIAHFHANDANGRGPGFGDVDFLPIARALRKVGYNGFVSVEAFDFRPDPRTIAVESLRYLKKTFSA